MPLLQEHTELPSEEMSSAISRPCQYSLAQTLTISLLRQEHGPVDLAAGRLVLIDEERRAPRGSDSVVAAESPAGPAPMTMTS